MIYQQSFAVSIILTFGIVVPSVADAATLVYDLAGDWSHTSNPNGVWSYNKSPGVPLTDFVADYDANHLDWFASPQPAWAAVEPQLPGHVPLWMKVVSVNNVGWDMPVGSVIMHGAEHLSPAVWPGATWTSPVSGTVTISGGVWMPQNLGRTMDWQILLDSTLMTDGRISSGDPYSSSNIFSFVDGSGGSSALTFPVNVGDVVTFQADRPFGTGDQLGVEFSLSVEAVPEPSTYALGVIGLVALVFVAHRAKSKP